MSSIFTEKINKVCNSLVNRMNSIISSHNTNSNAHSELFNDKIDKSDIDIDLSPTSPNPVSNSAITQAINSLPGTGDIPTGSTTATDIQMDGPRSAGLSEKFARADHVHPTDSSRAASDHTHGYITNDGKIEGSLISNENNTPVINQQGASGTLGQISKGYIPTQYTKEYQALSNIVSTVNPTQKEINTAINTKFGQLDNVATSGSYNDLSDTPTYSFTEITPSSDVFKSYAFTKNGTQVGSTINIPKDYLVKSGSVKTAGATLTSAESNAGVGKNEKYISLIVNTKDNSGTNTELIIPAKDLISEYNGDNETIVIENNVISLSSDIYNMVAGYTGEVNESTLNMMNQILINAIDEEESA